jgi:hypothetical protein
MKFIGVLAILLLVFTVGCGKAIMEGKRIDASQRMELIRGQNAAGVVAMLGEPAKIEKLASGEEKYTYNYYKEEYTHWWTLPKYERQKMDVFLKNGIVQNFVYTLETRGTPAEIDK